MLGKRIKDNKVRILHKKQELFHLRKKFISKYLLFDLNFSKNLNVNSMLWLFFSNFRVVKKQSKTKIVRRCIFTTRSRISSRKFSTSRILLRELLRSGVVPGYTKAIW
jgi:ribosomal protein S14